MKSILITIVCLVLFFIFGYCVGKLDIPENNYKNGIVSFCELSEGDRVKVCPFTRVVENFGKGKTITHICDNKFSKIYIESVNLSEMQDMDLQESLDVLSKDMNVNTICYTGKGEIYELRLK